MADIIDTNLNSDKILKEKVLDKLPNKKIESIVDDLEYRLKRSEPKFVNNNAPRNHKYYGEFHIFYKNIDSMETMVIRSNNKNIRFEFRIPENLFPLYINPKTGEPDPYLIKTAKHIARLFRLSGTDAIYKIATAIADQTIDFIHMKPSEIM